MPVFEAIASGRTTVEELCLYSESTPFNHVAFFAFNGNIKTLNLVCRGQDGLWQKFKNSMSDDWIPKGLGAPQIQDYLIEKFVTTAFTGVKISNPKSHLKISKNKKYLLFDFLHPNTFIEDRVGESIDDFEQEEETMSDAEGDEHADLPHFSRVKA